MNIKDMLALVILGFGFGMLVLDVLKHVHGGSSTMRIQARHKTKN